MTQSTTPLVARSVTLHVDTTDPFYFDHPLDHIPGTLLVAGLLTLARAQPEHDGHGRMTISLTFSRICNPEDEVLLHCLPMPTDGEPRWEAWAEQNDAPVCTSVIGVEKTTDPATRQPLLRRPPVRAGARDPRPAEAHLVHRSRAENVMIGEPRRTPPFWAEAAVLAPPPGHRLNDADQARHTPEALIESARQMATLLGHTAHGRESDSQMLWTALEADLPTDLPSAVPLALRWNFAPNDGRRARYEMSLVGAADGRRYGWIAIGVYTLSQARYLDRKVR